MIACGGRRDRPLTHPWRRARCSSARATPSCGPGKSPDPRSAGSTLRPAPSSSWCATSTAWTTALRPTTSRQARHRVIASHAAGSSAAERSCKSCSSAGFAHIGSENEGHAIRWNTAGDRFTVAQIITWSGDEEGTMASQLVNGLGGAIGCRYLPTHNQLVFVEFNGKVSVVDLIRPLAATVSSGTAVLKGTWVMDLETGVQSGSMAPGDIWWEQQTAVIRDMRPVGGAKIVNLGHVNYNTVTFASLQTLNFNATPIPGNNDPSNQLTDGDVFAVLTNAGNYAKVQVLHYDYNMTIRWATYKLGPRYRVLGTGYTNPEDIAVSADETTAYVTERSGDLVRVPLAAATRAG